MLIRCHTLGGQRQTSNTCIQAGSKEKYMLGESVKNNDLTACLSALLPEDECAREALEGSSLPVRRDTEWGTARVLLPPSSSDPWGVCGRKRRL